jgi:mRNA interferase HicA
MRRVELERRLRALGWWILRHGGRHDVWTNGEGQEAVPRHREIHEQLARRILERARRKS